LDGTIKPVEGMLPAIMAAKKESFKKLYLPPLKEMPLTQIDGIELRFVQSIHEVIESISGQLTTFSLTTNHSPEPPEHTTPNYDKDFKQVIGHQHAKRALEIAAAGGHNILMVGPPG